MRGVLMVGAIGLLWLSTLAMAQAPVPPQPAAPGAATAGQPRRPPGASPASERIPTRTPQSYPAEQVQAGRALFSGRCGFCHGRDAEGGETGPDLTRSALVAEDVRGDRIAPVIRSGRPDKGMPPFPMTDDEMRAVVAFIHDTKAKADATGGGRRSVDVADLQTGDAASGRRYFNGPGGCVRCHAVEGTFATIGARLQGLPLLQRMLYPGSGGRAAGAPPKPPRVTVTTKAGQTITGALQFRDEFTISLTDTDGWVRSWPLDAVQVSVDDPLRAHVEQLGKYTDEDMHDVLAYLQTLK